MRQIFIFCNLSVEEQASLALLVQCISDKVSVCELSKGYQAYEFLLRWSVGLLNATQHHNDRFVLGKCRSLWTSFCEEKSNELKGHPFLKVMQQLMSDAHSIRSIIERNLSHLPPTTRIEQTEALCLEQRKLRERDENAGSIRFIYPFLAELASGPTEDTEKTIEKLSKKISSLQKELSAQNRNKTIEPNPESKKEKSALSMTQMAIAACWAKRQFKNKLQSHGQDEELAVNLGNPQ
ncbi:hypothetical protein [Legionella jordanis]|uniref:hypothetical protein n=1 Tax=Legionella jordanis TaxID=456 RepID=UPI000F826B00|nr:hypothetical protein [Legionella jordanis]